MGMCRTSANGVEEHGNGSVEKPGSCHASSMGPAGTVSKAMSSETNFNVLPVSTADSNGTASSTVWRKGDVDEGPPIPHVPPVSSTSLKNQGSQGKQKLGKKVSGSSAFSNLSDLSD